jgi:teichuronic acid biosynthesis glycosyltransferase TuaC
MRVLMITSVWPTADHPERAPFVVRQVKFLRRRGVTVDVLHVDGRRNPANYFNRWREVRRRLAAHPYDVVHAQWGQAALVALPSGLPLVITFRGSDLEGIVTADGRYGWQSAVLTSLSRIAGRSADQIIVVSEQLRRHFPGRACHVIPSGVDVSVFAPAPQLEARARLGLSPTRKYVLFAASPDRPVKRYPLAVRTVAHLQEEFDLELLVAANVPPTVMPLYMNACDALLLTSFHEGSPDVVKEALACNLPVVSVDVGDVRARVGAIDGCAVCVEAAPEALAKELRAVLARGRRIGAGDHLQELDESTLTAKVIAVYDRAIADRRR